MTSTIQIDQDKCSGCGLCVGVCPNRILQKNSQQTIEFIPQRLWSCFQCGHCMAICPKQAIQIAALSYDTDFYPMPFLSTEANPQFEQLIASRRAIRNFQDRPVEHALLEKIVETIRQAPPAFPPVKTEVTVINDRALLNSSLPLMIEVYASLLSAMKNPIARGFVKREVGREKYITLREHVVPLMEDRLPDLRSGKEDTIMRYAPALILFHADRNSENYIPDIYIALTYGFLAAHSLGLGASAMDLIPPAVEKSPQLRKLFQIPDQNEVVASMIVGYPQYKFQRGIRRSLRSETWIEPVAGEDHA